MVVESKFDVISLFFQKAIDILEEKVLLHLPMIKTQFRYFFEKMDFLDGPVFCNRVKLKYQFNTNYKSHVYILNRLRQ